MRSRCQALFNLERQQKLHSFSNVTAAFYAASQRAGNNIVRDI